MIDYFFEEKKAKGRLVEILEDDLICDHNTASKIKKGDKGVIINVITKYPDGNECAIAKYVILLSSGCVITLESIGETFWFI